MPKRVDHDQRRRHIADALLRVAAAQGLHAAGFREVAAEAGVSVRLVQYYFETKEQLLLFGLRRVGEQFTERVQPRLASGVLPPAGRARIEFVLTATLPLDAESRSLYVLYNQYFRARAHQSRAGRPALRERPRCPRDMACRAAACLPGRRAAGP